ncbi:hypothetical protein F5Y00DRAFT_249814 [Daldinia vernicosa]|uniref:uncharacterized protein n=1 Tax=Daldinia vernicosa TaxID=114800 RepID=UPI00200786C4|nr:uncharacterized protein F5Y00DRAFT_249814 [Daldinia vernicosa]KAI0843960.1 hypothetical protein F5Y00DRAFT_249814 [Daldinia vernicosa]
MSEIYKENLFITLQFLRNVNGQNKYHWGLFLSGSSPPAGILMHATDTNRAALDLYLEERRVSNPLRSGTMVVVLKIADAPSLDTLRKCASSIHLMDPRYLPRGEDRWTCRVWVKEMLKSLHKHRCISLPADVDVIEQYCQYMADSHLQYKGDARVFNDLNWVRAGSSSSSSKATLSEADARGGGRYYGPSPMNIDSTGGRYYGSSPMVIDSTTKRYYGPSPMDTRT